MSKSLKQTTKVRDLSCLHPGELVRAHLPGTLLIYEGEAETIIPEHGVLWIRHGVLNERKLIDVHEYDLFVDPVRTPISTGIFLAEPNTPSVG